MRVLLLGTLFRLEKHFVRFFKVLMRKKKKIKGGKKIAILQENIFRFKA